MRARAASLAACLALLAVACGSDTVGPSPERELDPAKANAAERAALGWYRAIGEREPIAVVLGMSKAARRPLKLNRTGAQIMGAFGAWAGSTEPSLLYSERHGAKTTVVMRIEGGERYGPTLVHRGTFLLALPLVWESRGWPVDDSAWLRSRVDAFHDAEAWRRQFEEDVRGETG